MMSLNFWVSTVTINIKMASEEDHRVFCPATVRINTKMISE
jgi:hypothetical protein